MTRSKHHICGSALRYRRRPTGKLSSTHRSPWGIINKKHRSTHYAGICNWCIGVECRAYKHSMIRSLF